MYIFLLYQWKSKTDRKESKKFKIDTTFLNISFVIIKHIKEGKFRGVNAHAHELDVIIEVEKGKAIQLVG